MNLNYILTCLSMSVLIAMVLPFVAVINFDFNTGSQKTDVLLGVLTVFFLFYICLLPSIMLGVIHSYS